MIFKAAHITLGIINEVKKRMIRSSIMNITTSFLRFRTPELLLRHEVQT